MYTISKTFTFEAAHQLPADLLPPGHPCAELHGHSYSVTLVLAHETLVPPGFVVDYRDLAQFRAYIDATLDHHFLNDVLSPTPTTAEHLAHHLYNVAGNMAYPVVAVTVKETAKTSATYSPTGTWEPGT